MEEPDMPKIDTTDDTAISSSRLPARPVSENREVWMTFFLFSFSILMGIVLKLWFGSLVTIGYDDYRVRSSHSTVQLSTLQTKVLEQGGSLAYVPKMIDGPACRQDDSSKLHP